MKTLRESEHFPAHGTTAPVTVVLRDNEQTEQRNGAFGKFPFRYIVQTRNDLDGKFYHTHTTTSLESANLEFNMRVRNILFDLENDKGKD